MVLKRIISCLAIISVVFLMSCYDVGYDKDDGAAATEKNWAEGLTTKQMVEGMEIKAEAKSSSKSESEIQVSWIFPLVVNKWAVKFKIVALDQNDCIDWTDIPVEEIKKDPEPVGTYKYTKYFLWFKRDYTVTQYLVLFKVMMTDTNGDPYENIVSFLVQPENRTLRITFVDSEAAVNSKVYGAWISECLFNIIKTIGSSSDVPGAHKEFSLVANSPVFFWIESDFSSQGLATVTHFSNSSYCKVRKLDTPNTIEKRNVEATLEYSFEDLPQFMINSEPLKKFDYNDVVFHVDIIKD